MLGLQIAALLLWTIRQALGIHTQMIRIMFHTLNSLSHLLNPECFCYILKSNLFGICVCVYVCVSARVRAHMHMHMLS